jgi:hypothetical protein
LAELAQQQRAAAIRKNRPAWGKTIHDLYDNVHVVKEVSEHHFKMARVNSAADWENWSLTERATAAWVELFVEKDWVLRTVAVECVGYSKALYNKLVEIGAHNGQTPFDEEEEEAIAALGM